MMATKRKQAATGPIVPMGDSIVLTGNVVYADTLVQLGIGPFVSRATFGSQVGPTQVAPNLQLVMPSNALLAFASHVIDMFAQGNIVQKFEKNHAQFQEQASAKVISAKRRLT